MNRAEDVVFHLDAVCQSVVDSTRFKIEKLGPVPVEVLRDLQRSEALFREACQTLQAAIVKVKLRKG